jgi:AcrR family transcriptional regulator
MKRQPKPVRGRPRSFDRDQVLDRAMLVFWHRGYDGASLSELTKALGINRPSLYAAFGDKESLFRQALDRYMSNRLGFADEALKEPTARGFAEKLLFGSADSMFDAGNPTGCLLVQGAPASGHGSESVRREVIARRQANEAIVRRRLKRAKAEGDLPAGSDPVALARFLSTVSQGMAVQATSGASRNDLRRVAETALRAWPT